MFRSQLQRNVADSADIQRNILTCRTVAASRRLRQFAVDIQNTHRQAVQFRFATKRQRIRHCDQSFLNTSDKGGKILIGKSVIQ